MTRYLCNSTPKDKTEEEVKGLIIIYAEEPPQTPNTKATSSTDSTSTKHPAPINKNPILTYRDASKNRCPTPTLPPDIG